ncbi:hypothetical protein L3V83_11625 [Thiotrichales bacterium 19X7-9]|nr:hypothetical protein [Thiotrichales bacterium 19X7-9]
MYVSIRQYKLIKGTVEVMKEKVEKTFLPEIRLAEGFVDYSVIVGEKTINNLPHIITISIFKEVQFAAQSSQIAAKWAQQMLPYFEFEKISETRGYVANRG